MSPLNKRDLLENIHWDGKDRALSLIDALIAARRAQYSSTKDGLFLIGTSGNNQSVTFQIPAASAQLSPALISAALVELYDLYDKAKVELLTEGNATPTDQEIVDRIILMPALIGRNSESVDYSLMSQVGA